MALVDVPFSVPVKLVLLVQPASAFRLREGDVPEVTETLLISPQLLGELLYQATQKILPGDLVIYLNPLLVKAITCGNKTSQVHVRGTPLAGSPALPHTVCSVASADGSDVMLFDLRTSKEIPNV